MSTVGLVKGEDRFANVLRALELAGDELARRVRGRVLIKVNTVVGSGSPADTHPEALRAVLEYLKRTKADRIMVGESAAQPDPISAFRADGLLDLARDYPVEFVDFNSFGFDEIELRTIEGGPLRASLSRIHGMFDCLISLSVPKAHSDAVLTLSGKNMMGFLQGGEEWRIHGIREFGADETLAACVHTIHRNLRTLLRHVRPTVAVLDAFHSFGGGTVPQCAKGELVEPRIALAGADFVAVDTVAATVLGFDPADIGYLCYSVEDGYGTGDLSCIEVRGTPIADATFRLPRPPRFERLVAWRE